MPHVDAHAVVHQLETMIPSSTGILLEFVIGYIHSR